MGNSEIDDQQPFTYYRLGRNYTDMNEYEMAISPLEKGLEIYEKWGSKPSWLPSWYSWLGGDYHITGQYNKEKELYKKAEKDFPDALYYRKAVLAFTLGDTVEANGYIEKFKSICKKNSVAEADIVAYMAEIYSHAGMPDKTKEYCRKLLSFQYVNPVTLNYTAYVLLKGDKFLNEVLQIADRVLKLNPEDYIALHRKGWAMYKQGKYKEALEILQRSWDIRMKKNAIYNHDAFTHLEEAKKAVQIKNNNKP
jgi:tetratricopeptide (TPR) repeat protein